MVVMSKSDYAWPADEFLTHWQPICAGGFKHHVVDKITHQEVQDHLLTRNAIFEEIVLLCSQETEIANSE